MERNNTGMSKRNGMNMVYARVIVSTCLTREVGGYMAIFTFLAECFPGKSPFRQNDKSKN